MVSVVHCLACTPREGRRQVVEAHCSQPEVGKREEYMSVTASRRGCQTPYLDAPDPVIADLFRLIWGCQELLGGVSLLSQWRCVHLVVIFLFRTRGTNLTVVQSGPKSRNCGKVKYGIRGGAWEILRISFLNLSS